MGQSPKKLNEGFKICDDPSFRENLDMRIIYGKYITHLAA
jgi:hypothetical protein